MSPSNSQSKGLLSRVRNRLSRLAGGIAGGGRAPTAGIGGGFSVSYEEEWNDLVEQVDNYTQKVGAAVVQTWEVGAAELSRVLIGLPDEKSMIERYSDSLVPTLTEFQDLHKKCSGAMAEGFKAGTANASMAAATAPLGALVDGLGGRAAAGWLKTAIYLEPIFALAVDPAAAKLRFEAAGAELAKGCDLAQATLRTELGAVPQNPKLWDGVCEAFDKWQLRLVRELEIEMTKATRQLVADVRAGRA